MIFFLVFFHKVEVFDWDQNRKNANVTLYFTKKKDNLQPLEKQQENFCEIIIDSGFTKTCDEHYGNTGCGVFKRGIQN